MSLVRRVRALEKKFGRPGDVTWEEANAAAERMEAGIMATLQAMVEGREPPPRDEAQDAADDEIIRRWERQQGTDEPEMSDEEVLERLRRMAAGTPL